MSRRVQIRGKEAKPTLMNMPQYISDEAKATFEKQANVRIVRPSFLSQTIRHMFGSALQPVLFIPNQK